MSDALTPEVEAAVVITCPVCKQAVPEDVEAAEWKGADGNDYAGHEVCYWKLRVQQEEDTGRQTHAMLCALVAARGGATSISPEHIERARSVGFKLEVEQGPGMKTILRLAQIVQATRPALVKLS